MEQDAQTDVLYDFLYRDSSRITSYYAQIFGGKLTSLENTDTDSSTRDTGGKMDLGLLGGDLKSGKETSQSQTRTIDPHDLIATDVLVQLSSDNRLNINVSNAAHGSLVLTTGTLLLIGKTLLWCAAVVLESEAKEAANKARSDAEKASARAQQRIISMMRALILPSGFLLRTSDGLDVVGTLKEDGMEEPISPYYFKHGLAGLASVHLIGIKEEPSHAVSLPPEKMIGMGQAFAKALQGLVFPSGAITVTPIALFREI